MQRILGALVLIAVASLLLVTVAPLGREVALAAAAAPPPAVAPWLLVVLGVAVPVSLFLGLSLGGASTRAALAAAGFVALATPLARTVAAGDVLALGVLVPIALLAGLSATGGTRRLIAGAAAVAIGAGAIALLASSWSGRSEPLRVIAAALETAASRSASPFVEVWPGQAALGGLAATLLALLMLAMLGARSERGGLLLLLGPLVAGLAALLVWSRRPDALLNPGVVVAGQLLVGASLAALLAARPPRLGWMRGLAVLAALAVSAWGQWRARSELRDVDRFTASLEGDRAYEPVLALTWSAARMRRADPEAPREVVARLSALLLDDNLGGRAREDLLLAACEIEREQGHADAALELIARHGGRGDPSARVKAERLRDLALTDAKAFHAELSALSGSEPPAEVSAAAGVGLLALGGGAPDAALAREAQGWLERALVGDPQNYDAMVALGSALRAQGKLVDAIRVLERAAELRADRAEAPIELARLYFAQNEMEGGQRQLGCAFALDRRSPLATFVLVQVVFDSTRDKDKGLRLMQSALERNPLLPNGWTFLSRSCIALAQLEVSRGETDAARRHIEQAVRADPSCAPAHQLLGNLFARENDLPHAEKSLSQAYALDPKLPDIDRDLGEVLKRIGYQFFLAGDRAAARPYFERLLQLNPPGIKLTAISALLNGDVETASREAPPDDPVVTETERERLKQEARSAYERAMELIATGDDAGGESQLRASLAALPANPYAHFELGKLQRRRGEDAAALASLRESYTLMRELKMEIPAAYVELADSLLSAGQKGEALTMIDLYLQRFPEGKDRARAERLREQAK